MVENIRVICLKTHGVYQKGSIYDCICTKFKYTDNENEYKIYNDEACFSYDYARKGRDHCNLDYFNTIEDAMKFKLKKHTKYCIPILLIIKSINKILNKNIKEYFVQNCKYNLINSNENTCKFIYVNIISPIKEIEDSEFYVYHQEKIYYILSNILTMYKLSEYRNLSNEIMKCSKIIKLIYESIKIQESKIDKENKRITKEKIDMYMEKQNQLFNQWETELKDLWSD